MTVLSPTLQSVAVIGTALLLLAYTLYKLTSQPQQQNITVTTDTHAEHSYRTPDDWDNEQPLCLCDDCGAFNHIEYQYCRGCATALQKSHMMPAHSVDKIQRETGNKPS